MIAACFALLWACFAASTYMAIRFHREAKKWRSLARIHAIQKVASEQRCQRLSLLVAQMWPFAAGEERRLRA